MNGVKESTAPATEVLDKYRLKPEDEKNPNELGKTAFLELMIAQLNNQNPTNPEENSEWVAQLAQFSSVESLENLNTSVSEMAGSFRSSQALQASAMVGRDVLVAAEATLKGDEGGFGGLIELPSGTPDLQVSIFNANGELAKTIELGPQTGGDVAFTWDGTNNSGTLLPAGTYSVRAEARFDGEMQQQNTFLQSSVESVSISAQGGVSLNLRGQGTVGMDDVKEIF